MIPANDPKDGRDVVSGLSGSEGPPQAIQIVKLGRGAGSAPAECQFCKPYDVEEVRERLEEKMRILRLQQDKAFEADGWTRFGDHWIPPGWVQGQ